MRNIGAQYLLEIPAACFIFAKGSKGRTRVLQKLAHLHGMYNCRHAVGNQTSELSLRRFIATTSTLAHDDINSKREWIKSGPSLSNFLNDTSSSQSHDDVDLTTEDNYLGAHLFQGHSKRVYIETYGCQMNVNDTEIAWSILLQNGFEKAVGTQEADVVLLMTCSIREGAEGKIWERVHQLASIKKRRGRRQPLKIGILGCMAERLKHKIVEKEKTVDIVCGPDAYRDLPRLLAVASATAEAAVNVQLSVEETYADVVPVRINPDSPSAFVSIMRGCDNMCTYCIVPFTRGRERSRPMSSIVEEIKSLSEQGVKDVTLLGQNVNSYRDLSSQDSLEEDRNSSSQLSAGFSTVYKPKTGGHRFARLLEEVAQVDPEMRIRFTSPHPKDFPDQVLEVILNHPNICKHIHLPAQSGNSEVLAAMGRGYTRETYLQLVEHVREIMPGVALSSDFIAGFCGETEPAHQDTLSLMDTVKYNFVYCFPYSMRQKTRAFHRLIDNVPVDVKLRRNEELHVTFRKHAEALHLAQVGEIHLVLVEGESKRSAEDLAGRNDANTKVVFHHRPLKYGPELLGEESRVQPGDYVAVEITSSTSQVLKGRSLYRTTLQDFFHTGNISYKGSNLTACL
ncbi:unnamed protein product [Candidula unifasciata]|uniref:CDK5 regulatory subunit-associated protein 1 n=1 Tax=Candidula unifasciata TaxID=100452 RepID=A0A8S4A5X7_9EUPU|nr:unnamed protein product [Candidula unifasciata]